jgi:hypothetical protein
MALGYEFYLYVLLKLITFMDKLGRIEKFIESLEVEEISEHAQAMLLVGSETGVFGGGANEDCSNSNSCTDSINIGCSNSKDCFGSSNSGCSNAISC